MDKFLDYLAWMLLMTVILLLRFRERLLDNIIQANSFLWEYALYGLVFSFIFLFCIYKIRPNYYKGGKRRASAVLSFFFGVLLLFIFGTAYYNFQTAEKNKKTIHISVLDKFKNQRYNTPYLTLHINNKAERFQPTMEEWQKIQKNDSIYLSIGQGVLGYQHIFTFSPHLQTK